MSPYLYNLLEYLDKSLAQYMGFDHSTKYSTSNAETPETQVEYQDVLDENMVNEMAPITGTYAMTSVQEEMSGANNGHRGGICPLTSQSVMVDTYGELQTKGHHSGNSLAAQDVPESFTSLTLSIRYPRE